MIKKGEIVEVDMMFPDGHTAPHPALVVSEAIPEDDGTAYYDVVIARVIRNVFGLELEFEGE